MLKNVEKKSLSLPTEVGEYAAKEILLEAVSIQIRKMIKEKAYFLWEREGKQEGKQDYYWDKAAKELNLNEIQSQILETICSHLNQTSNLSNNHVLAVINKSKSVDDIEEKNLFSKLNKRFVWIERHFIEPMDRWIGRLEIFSIFGKISPLIEAVGVIAIPIVLAIAAHLGQKALESREEERLRQIQVGEYLSQLSSILLESKNNENILNDEKIRVLTTATTLTLFRDPTMDGARKGQIIGFLSEMGLIQFKLDDPDTDADESADSIISLKTANLRDANLQDLNLESVNFREAHLSGANFQRASLQEASFWRADLSNSNLKALNSHYASFYRANLKKANLSGTIFQNASFSDADLEGANLQGSYLQNTRFFEAYLVDANLQYAKMMDADVEDSSLRNANLQGADMNNVDLSESRLNGANLKNANLKNAILLITDLRGSKNLKPEQLMGSNHPLLCNTALPSYLMNIGIDPYRDCDRIPQALSKRYKWELQRAIGEVNEARQKTWD